MSIQRNALFAFMALTGATPVFATDCHKLWNTFDFVSRSLRVAGGLPGCYPTPEALKEALWAAVKPIIEKPLENSDYVETSTVSPGPCQPAGFHDVLPYPLHQCSYSILTKVFYKVSGNTTSSVTNKYFDMTMDCGAYLNSNWRADLNRCMRWLDERPANTCTPQRGNPIGILTGLKSQRERIVGWGRGHELVLSYAPRDAALLIDRYPGGPATFGRLWQANLLKRVMMNGSLYTPIFMRGDGTSKSFQSFGDQASTPLELDKATFVRNETSWNYYDTSASAVERYVGDSRPELTRVHYADGRYLDYLYGGVLAKEGGTMSVRVITAVRDETGRMLSFEYEPDPYYFSTVRVKSVIDAGGRRHSFQYGVFGGLASIGHPDNTSRSYRYEDAAHTWAITSLVDEAGDVHGSYTYDSEGRAVSTATGSNGERWQVSWPTPPQWTLTLTDDIPNSRTTRRLDVLQAVSANVTGPDGRTTGVASQQIAGSTVTKGLSQPAGSGCEAASSTLDYDTEGNVSRRADFNGGQTCHANIPVRHLESSRVEGLASGAACAPVLSTGATLPAGARKVSSQWHPDWRMATKTAEPRRITTLVYNGQPDPFNGNAVASCAPADAKLPDGKPIVVLCKRVEHATTDETGALGFNAVLQSGVPARATAWTYNATGQVLTESDPRGNVVVVNEYYTDTTADHTKGDLKSSQNAVGQITSFLRYDAYGKPLEVVDANTSTTTYVYDLRQRLTSVTTADSTSTYEYWPTGLLKKSSQLDGSAVNYEYDDAHRLVAASDTRGNRVEYTLDQSGNKTNEIAKDPQGALKRSMSRAFDALGRAQQTTGRE
ncbi:RHS repeat domain-containing protein [Mitsuaria sp. 7]|uniref:RHS repeat domain-containing protein n=1 Tax=Mitsuaria sp. 7 TaxID=1658665 RepID=UPI0008339B3F|nr:RHS repeat protein [Mitsuaria sp. 7]